MGKDQNGVHELIQSVIVERNPEDRGRENEKIN